MDGGSAGAWADERYPFICLRSPGADAGAASAGEDHRLHRLPAHAAVQFAVQYPGHHRMRAAVVVPAGVLSPMMR